MKKLLALIITFVFIYPVFLNFLPIPLDRILQLSGLAMLCLYQNDLKRILNSSSVWAFVRVTFVLLLLAFFAQLQLSRGLDLYFFKEVFDTILNVFSAYLVCWSIRSAYGYINAGLVMYYIVLAGIVQTFISFAFFFNNSLFDIYISFLKEETNQGLLNRTSSIARRFMGFGSQFFSGVIKYGIAFFGVLVLPYIHRCRLTTSKWLYWGSVVLIGVGGIFTGRSFFIGLFLSVFMLVILRSKNIVSFIINNVKAVIAILLLGAVLSSLALLFVESDRIDAIYSFAFELFINVFENDSLETNSTNHLTEMYFFPNNINTWIFGDGKMLADTGYYMGTDVGYIRLLFYFGLPSTLFFIYVLFRYCKLLGKQTDLRAMKYFLFFVTLWMLVLNFKGLAFMTEYFVLFMLAFLFEKYNKRI